MRAGRGRKPVDSSRALILSAPCFDVVRRSAATSRVPPCDDSLSERSPGSLISSWPRPLRPDLQEVVHAQALCEGVPPVRRCATGAASVPAGGASRARCLPTGAPRSIVVNRLSVCRSPYSRQGSPRTGRGACRHSRPMWAGSGRRDQDGARRRPTPRPACGGAFTGTATARPSAASSDSPEVSATTTFRPRAMASMTATGCAS